MSKRFLFFLLVIIVMFFSCVKKPSYPSTPVLKYKDFIRYGNPSAPDSTELVVSFTDGEGDIGLEQADKVGILKDGNLFMVYYYDSAGTWSPYDITFPPAPPFDTAVIIFTVPPVLPKGDNSEPVKGNIYVKQWPIFKPADHKKIKYIIYMYDKALNKSDTIHTPALIF